MPPANLTDDTPTLTTKQLSARLQELERWRSSVLSGDLEALRQRKQRLQEDLRGYEELESNAAKLIADKQTTLETSVDIGCGVRVAAHVPDTSRLYVSVGLGFHVEALLGEVAGLVGPRKEHLQALLRECEAKLEQVEAQAAAFDESVRRLRSGEVEEMEEEKA